MQVDSNGIVLELPENGGVYTVGRDDERHVVTIQSPVSGGFRYQFDVDNAVWMSDEDSHNILELLVSVLHDDCALTLTVLCMQLRELIVVCHGCPTF